MGMRIGVNLCTLVFAIPLMLTTVLLSFFLNSSSCALLPSWIHQRRLLTIILVIYQCFFLLFFAKNQRQIKQQNVHIENHNHNDMPEQRIEYFCDGKKRRVLMQFYMWLLCFASNLLRACRHKQHRTNNIYIIILVCVHPSK